MNIKKKIDLIITICSKINEHVNNNIIQKNSKKYLKENSTNTSLPKTIHNNLMFNQRENLKRMTITCNIHQIAQ